MYFPLLLLVWFFVLFEIQARSVGVEFGNSLWIAPNRTGTLSKAQIAQKLVSGWPKNKIFARAFQKPTNLWPEGQVFYILDDSYDDYETNLIREAMNEIESKSCVKFIQRENDEPDYVFIRNLHTCSSKVGKIGDQQSLPLSSKRCMKIGIIVHELMHTLGFEHEHSRPDRDDYITINSENIDDEFIHNFDRLDPDNFEDLEESYDFDSVMHYDAFAYAVDRSIPTIVSLKPDGNLKVREDLSAADIRKLNKLYKCPSS